MNRLLSIAASRELFGSLCESQKSGLTIAVVYHVVGEDGIPVRNLSAAPQKRKFLGTAAQVFALLPMRVAAKSSIFNDDVRQLNCNVGYRLPRQLKLPLISVYTQTEH